MTGLWPRMNPTSNMVRGGGNQMNHFVIPGRQDLEAIFRMSLGGVISEWSYGNRLPVRGLQVPRVGEDTTLLVHEAAAHNHNHRM